MKTPNDEWLLLWQEILNYNLKKIWKINNLHGNDDITNELYLLIDAVFTTLKNIKNDRFYTPREIQTIYMMIKDTISYINDIIAFIPGIADEVYKIINKTFDNLILLGEEFTFYEVSGNLLQLKDYWFDTYNIKIKEDSADKKVNKK